MGNSSSSNLPVLQSVAACNTSRFMGTWFVIAVKPTMFEKTCSNAVEKYTLQDVGQDHDVDISFRYNENEPITSPIKSLPQKGWIQGNREDSGTWKVSPFWPIKMPYQIIELDDNDYSYCVIGYPSRDYFWIMSRTPKMPETTYETMLDRLVQKHQYNLDGMRKVPQKWTRDEREKRKLTEKEIPDSMLETE